MYRKYCNLMVFNSIYHDICMLVYNIKKHAGFEFFMINLLISWVRENQIEPSNACHNHKSPLELIIQI